MIRNVGGYHLRLLWNDLQALEPDENGIIHFSFGGWKRQFDIAEDAEAPEMSV